jgi:F-type H+-transporting ATPase subunit b
LEELLNILNPMASTIFWSILVFIAIVIIMWRFVFKPVNRIVSKRQAEIKKNVNNAEKQMEEIQKYLDKQKGEIEKAREKAEEIIEDGKREAGIIREKIENDAKEKSRRMIENTLQEIKIEREKSLVDLRDRMVDMALNATEKVIGKSLSKKEHEKIIKDSLQEIGNIKIG